jgi:hypothetical protein
MTIFARTRPATPNLPIYATSELRNLFDQPAKSDAAHESLAMKLTADFTA